MYRSKALLPGMMILALTMTIGSRSALAQDAEPAAKAAPPAASQPAAATSTDETKSETKEAAPAGPKDVPAAIKLGKEVFTFAKAGKWLAFSSALIMLLVFLMKLIGKKMGWWTKLGRWRYVIVPLLSLTSAILAALQGDLSFESAAAVFGTNWATASLQEFWEHGFLGKPREGS